MSSRHSAGHNTARASRSPHSEGTARHPAVCSKRATLLDNADRASRKPRCGLELNKRLNVKWPAIRAWGQYHSRILDRWAANTGRLEGATAEKAVPFPCAARRSVVLRLAELTCMTTSRGAK